MTERIISNNDEAILAERQGFIVPAHSDEDYPFTVYGARHKGKWRVCVTCGRDENNHNVRHPFKVWSPKR